MAKNFPKLVKEKDTQVQEAQNPKKMKTKRPTRHINKITKIKDQERIWAKMKCR